MSLEVSNMSLLVEFFLSLGGIGGFIVGVIAIIKFARKERLKGKGRYSAKYMDRPDLRKELDKLYESILKDSKSFLIDVVFAEAYELRKEGKTEEAIKKWRSLANIAEGIDDDLAALAFTSIGYLYEKEGAVEDGISALDRAIDLNPDNAEAYHIRGTLRFMRQLKETITEGHENQLLRIQERADFFLEDYNKAIELEPNYADAYTDRGNIKKFIGQNEEALADYNIAINFKPDSAHAYANRGDLKFNMGGIDEASADFETALRLAEEQGISGIEELVSRKTVSIRVDDLNL